MSDIQSLSMEDLIPGRKIDDLVMKNPENREFMVTGSGGSIGSEIVRQIINQNPKKLYFLIFQSLIFSEYMKS